MIENIFCHAFALIVRSGLVWKYTWDRSITSLIGAVAFFCVIGPTSRKTNTLWVSRASVALAFLNLLFFICGDQWTYAHALIVEAQDLIIFTD